MLGIKGVRLLIADHSIRKHTFSTSKTSKCEDSRGFRIAEGIDCYSLFTNQLWAGAAIISSVGMADMVDTVDTVADMAMAEAMAEATEGMEEVTETMAAGTEVAMDILTVVDMVVGMVVDTADMVDTDGNSNVIRRYECEISSRTDHEKWTKSIVVH